MLLLATAASGQVQKTPPACAARAICFSGRVEAGQEFRQRINDTMEFVLRPGWTITVMPVKPGPDCDDFASVMNPPFRSHRSLYIDMTYGWTAEQEISISPREFQFVTNCADYQAEGDRLDIALWPADHTEAEYKAAITKLGKLRHGDGRLWITDSKITDGKIEWMKFTVELKLPRR